MPLNRNDFIPQSLTTVYSSPSGMTDVRTGLPYYAGGLIVGTYFDLTEAEAQALSQNVLHEGRYRFVKVDSTATAANIKTGTIGLLSTLANAYSQQPNLVTSYDAGALNPRFYVFLAPVTTAQVTAGAYIFVQEQGTANVLGTTSITATPAIGDVIIPASAANGTVDDPTQSGSVTYAIYKTILGYALDKAIVGASGTFRMLIDQPVVQG